MDPITRKETYLAKLSGQDVSIPSPITREEFYLAKLCGEDVTVPTPITIDEYYLAALCGEVNSVPYPVTRLQMIWAKLLEMNVVDVTPVTREETLWANITLAKWDTITGNPVSFSAKAAPLKQLEVAFSPKQEGSGDPSPDNVRPISGWSEVTVEQYGANLADPDALVAGYINNSGEIAGQSQTQLEYSSDFIPMPPNTQRITVGYNGYESGEAAWMGVAIYDENKDFIQRIANTVSTWKYTAYVAGRNAAYFRFTARTYGHGLDKMFCGIGDVSEFTPFTGHRSISINLGSSVYSGTVDVVTGVLTATWAKSLLKDLAWSWFYKSAGILMADPPKANGKANLLFTSFKYSGSVQYHSLSNGEATGRDDAATIYVCNTAFAQSTIDDWLATLTADDYVVYELATPLTIQLTPQEVQSLLGVNNMWTDGDSLTVEYRSN